MEERDFQGRRVAVVMVMGEVVGRRAIFIYFFQHERVKETSGPTPKLCLPHHHHLGRFKVSFIKASSNIYIYIYIFVRCEGVDHQRPLSMAATAAASLGDNNDGVCDRLLKEQLK